MVNPDIINPRPGAEFQRQGISTVEMEQLLSRGDYQSVINAPTTKEPMVSEAELDALSTID